MKKKTQPEAKPKTSGYISAISSVKIQADVDGWAKVEIQRIHLKGLTNKVYRGVSRASLLRLLRAMPSLGQEAQS